MENCHS